MKIKAGNWGKAVAIRIPASVCGQLDISTSEVLDLDVVDGTIVLKPIKMNLNDVTEDELIASMKGLEILC